MEEIWKPIKGYVGIYRVSNTGRIFNVKFFKEVKSCDNGRAVCLWKDGKRKNHKIGHLVATAFIPNPENKPKIKHLNGVKNDNRVENLKWVTHKELFNL